MKKIHLRSDTWFGPDTRIDLLAHHIGKLINAKFSDDELRGTNHFLKDRTTSGRRPIIGICRFGGDLNPCQSRHDMQLGDRVADGIRSAGGIPFRFDAAPPLGEPISRPTAMLMRNLTAQTLIETIIANPLDGLVLLTGCDKTVPAGLMAVLYTNIPAIFASAGPMGNGFYQGEVAASGVHLWKSRELMASGEITAEDLLKRSRAAQPTMGHCMTMGTASTMNSMAEALGLALPGSSSIPSMDAERAEASYKSGQLAVELVLEDRRPSSFIDRQSFLNAIAANSAVGGSTNAVIHLTAAARMGGIDLTLDDWEKFGRDVPLLVNVKPAGQYLMQEYHRAGGLPAVLRELAANNLFDAGRRCCTGRSFADEIDARDPYVGRDVIRPFSDPLLASSGIVVLRGNIAPDGAVLKISAAKNKALFQHRGQAVVFDNVEDYHRRIDDEREAITPDRVLVLRNCGPVGYPGMPEVGNVRIPGYLLKQGVKEMVTVSDARMSGTAYGCHVLHVTPEAAIGGPLALVQTGDWITLDVAGGRITLDIDDGEWAARQKALQITPVPIHSPWQYLQAHGELGVHQANLGAYLKLYEQSGLTPARMAEIVRNPHLHLRPQH